MDYMCAYINVYVYFAHIKILCFNQRYKLCDFTKLVLVSEIQTLWPLLCMQLILLQTLVPHIIPEHCQV